MRESESGEEGERRTPEGEGDRELLSRRKLFPSREGSRAHGRASERDRETKKRSSPPASPRDGNSVAREGARRERETGEREEKFSTRLSSRRKFRLSLLLIVDLDRSTIDRRTDHLDRSRRRPFSDRSQHPVQFDSVMMM